MLSERNNDGFIAVVEDSKSKTIRLTTRIDADLVTVESLTRCYELARSYGFGSRASDIQIVAKPTGATISADFPMCMTGQYHHQLRKHFVGLLRAAGVMTKPMVCPIRIPFASRHFMD